jgi:LuxR family transcriptional regulator, maltose regulon positive regulatory protein
MNGSMVIQSQLLATKFFVPVASGTLISRPRLTALLQASLKSPLTLVCAAAGFGKTMLLSTWAQSLPESNPLLAWLSLDEEDNDPRLFWTYVLSALSDQQPERFTSLFKYLQSPEAPPLKYVLTTLSNLLLNSTEHFVLILDDYHVITEEEVHTTLSYLVEHLPRSFVDEGRLMKALLCRLQEEQRQQGPTPYLDTLLAAFQQESMAHVGVRAQAHF